MTSHHSRRSSNSRFGKVRMGSRPDTIQLNVKHWQSLSLSYVQALMPKRGHAVYRFRFIKKLRTWFTPPMGIGLYTTFFTLSPRIVVYATRFTLPPGGSRGTSGEGNLPSGEGNLPSGEGNLPSGEGNLPSGEGNLPSGEGNLPSDSAVRVKQDPLPDPHASGEREGNRKAS